MPQGRFVRTENPVPHRDWIPDRPARSSVAIPTDLPGPHSGPEGSKKSIFPDFMTTAQGGDKIVSLTHRPPVLIPVRD